MITKTKSNLLKVNIFFMFLAVYIFFTDPNKLSLPLLVVPFIILFIGLYLSVKELILRLKITQNDRRAVLIAVTCALLPVLLVVFQSIHQLSIRDVIVVIILVVVSVVYLKRADFIQ